MDSYVVIGNRIQSRRNQLGLSISQLAQSTGLSKSSLQRYENGHIYNMGIQYVVPLCEALHISIHDLFGIG